MKERLRNRRTVHCILNLLTPVVNIRFNWEIYEYVKQHVCSKYEYYFHRKNFDSVAYFAFLPQLIILVLAVTFYLLL